MKSDSALKITLIYFLVGILWIIFSDSLISALVGDLRTLANLQTYKGIFYITITAGLVFYLIRHYLKKESQLTAAVKDSEEKYREIVETTQEGVLIISPEGVVSFCNRKALDLLQVSREDLCGKKIQSLISDSFKEAVEDILKHPLEAKKNIEAQMIKVEGIPLWVMISWDHLLDREGRLKGFLLLLSDISGLKEKEREYNALLLEKEQILRDVRYRIKNNLQLISSIIHFYSEGVDYTDDLLQSLELRISAISMLFEHSAHGMPTNMILFSRYLEELVEQFKSLFQPIPANIEINLEAEDARINIDKALSCGFIIIELLMNTQEHAFPEGGSGKVNIRFYTQDNQAWLIYRDNGKGFSTDLISKPGKGIGLNIIQALVEKMRGSFQAEGEGGACFTIGFLVN